MRGGASFSLGVLRGRRADRIFLVTVQADALKGETEGEQLAAQTTQVRDEGYTEHQSSTPWQAGMREGWHM